MGVDTHRVEVVPVVLERHPDADSLSVVRIYNFTVVVRTADWEGAALGAYVQPDSVLPDRPEYRFLKETGNLRKEREQVVEDVASGRCSPDEGGRRIAEVEAKIDANTKRLRVTVQRLRGVLSMGLLLPAPEGAAEGDDVAGALGVTHYEPPSMDEIEGRRQHAGDDVAPAPPMVYAPKYDVESVYKYADCFEPGELVYVSEKLDGQNGRFVATDGGGPGAVEDTPGGQRRRAWPVSLHAGSRTEWKKREGGSNWWRVVEQNPWIEEWCLANQDKVLYGEVYGWVQALKYGAKPGQLFFRAFDILDGTEHLGYEDFVAALPQEHRVPSLGVMQFDFGQVQALADGPSLVPGASNRREGVVVKPVKERKHWKLGRVALKCVSNEYLEKSSR